MMLSSAATKATDKRLLTLLLGLVVACSIVFFDEDSNSYSQTGLRSLEDDRGRRRLAKNGASPPTIDEIPNQFIIKPWVGNAATDVYETEDDSIMKLLAAHSSSNHGSASEGSESHMIALDPNFVIDGDMSSHWASDMGGTGAEWIDIDMGLPQLPRRVHITFADAYAVDFNVQVSVDRSSWTTITSVSGAAYGTHDLSGWTPALSNGSRYMRINMTQRRAGYDNFSIYDITIWREKMIVDSIPDGISCGADVTAVKNKLLSTHGGTLIAVYELAEFFSATLTSAQQASMFADPCVFTVEPNYIVRARGKTTTTNRENYEEEQHEEPRRLAIPEFNLIDHVAASWGLSRISSRGEKSGKYIWLHEGFKTHTFIFDTGVYPDHSDWIGRNGTSRLTEGHICIGDTDDYDSNDHGTFVASIAGGKTFGTARSSMIHPIQVLGSNGEGTTASFLCGVEKILQDQIDYNLANAPEKMKGVVNLSLGVSGRSDALDKAVKDLTDAGFVVVIAAGDDDTNACFYSPYDHSAITVGALSDHATGANAKTASSNFGGCIDVWAPGEAIAGASNTGEYNQVIKSGTSVAAAFAAGVSTLFYEEIDNSVQVYSQKVFSARIKEMMHKKAEPDILDITAVSTNEILQTTTSGCKSNAMCPPGYECIEDGTCVDWQDYKDASGAKKTKFQYKAKSAKY